MGACNSPVQNVTTVKLDNNSIVVLDEEKVTEKKTVNLSDFVEDFQVIRFENKDEAFFKYNWMFFSDNYICVRQSGAPVKLFEKSGKYIGNVGNIGQGPGEYRAVYDFPGGRMLGRCGGRECGHVSEFGKYGLFALSA